MSDKENYTILLDYRGTERTPDGISGFASFCVSAKSIGFSGQTDFDATEDQIVSFVQKLDVFYKTLEPDIEFIAGWGTDVYFSLSFSRLDRRGNIELACKIRKPSLGARFDEIQIYQTVELQQIEKLSRFLRGIVTFGSPDTLSILPKI